MLYPGLAALICISPDRLDSAMGVLEGNLKSSSKVRLSSFKGVLQMAKLMIRIISFYL
jgi:hypothetical protein